MVFWGILLIRVGRIDGGDWKGRISRGEYYGDDFV